MVSPCDDLEADWGTVIVVPSPYFLPESIFLTKDLRILAFILLCMLDFDWTSAPMCPHWKLGMPSIQQAAVL